ncbi:MAG: hypothetical protein AAFQ82_19115 [Myxococcota bacterium]
MRVSALVCTSVLCGACAAEANGYSVDVVTSEGRGNSDHLATDGPLDSLGCASSQNPAKPPLEAEFVDLLEPTTDGYGVKLTEEVRCRRVITTGFVRNWGQGVMYENVLESHRELNEIWLQFDSTVSPSFRKNLSRVKVTGFLYELCWHLPLLQEASKDDKSTFFWSNGHCHMKEFVPTLLVEELEFLSKPGVRVRGESNRDVFRSIRRIDDESNRGEFREALKVYLERLRAPKAELSSWQRYLLMPDGPLGRLPGNFEIAAFQYWDQDDDPGGFICACLLESCEDEWPVLYGDVYAAGFEYFCTEFYESNAY